MNNNQLNELFHHLELIEKSNDEDVFHGMVDHITTLLRAVDNGSLLPVHRRHFVITKHLIHHLLVQNCIEPIEVTKPNSIPSSIADKKEKQINYFSKKLNFDVQLWIERVEDGIMFLLLSVGKDTNSSWIFIPRDTIDSFFGNDNICVERRNEAVKIIVTEIQDFLRGKSWENNALESR